MDENELFDTTELSLGKEMAKGAAISAASTAGMVAVLVGIGFAVDFVQKRREARETKKAAHRVEE